MNRIEWADAAHTNTDVHRPGTVIGDDQVDDEIAISFGADTLFVIEGTRRRIEELLETTLAAVRASTHLKDINPHR